MEAIPGDMRGQGFAVAERFLSHEEVLQLRICADLRRIRGDFRPAAVGAGSARRHEPEVRGDQICWVVQPYFPSERGFLDRLEQLRLLLNRELYLGLFDLELHYARYAPGAVYGRHVDRPAGTTQRKVSFIVYLNPDWSAQAGGELLLYDGARAREAIEPLGGRLVCFLTEGREHEVLPAKRTRLSLTGWFRTRA